MNDAVDVCDLRSGRLWYWCPGCNSYNSLPIDGESDKSTRWKWNGSLTAPTLNPSVLARTGELKCHKYVRDGKIEFLGDCSHELAGTTVAMKEFDLP